MKDKYNWFNISVAISFILLFLGCFFLSRQVNELKSKVTWLEGSIGKLEQYHLPPQPVDSIPVKLGKVR